MSSHLHATLLAEAEKANRMADRKQGQEIEDVAVSSCYRGHAHGLLHAAKLLRAYLDEDNRER